MSLAPIGPYDVIEELGSGGMGTVYLAEHSETRRRVAVKVLPASLSREPGFVARFNREIEALQKVHSPHIVELFESGVDGETYYYAMEYVDGETLTERLEREKRIPWLEVIDIGVQVCRALKAAHNAGVIHRDLKPSNLMLKEGNIVKLTDFGVAQLFAGGKLTATGGVVGTAEFMSPEQAEGKRATKQSDIYSLGAVMYVMLTGRPPFTGKTALDIAQKHRFGQFDSPRRFDPEIPSWLDDVVCRCLSKNPEQRYPDAYVLSLRLAEIPKKVELSLSGGIQGEVSTDGAAETVAANAEPEAGGGVAQFGGTFVRDMVRAELDRTTHQTPLESWLDNTWVLLLLLTLVVGGGYWLYQRRAIAPEEMFSAGEALMAEDDRGSWLEADERYFQPLLAQDAATWEPQIAPYLNRIALAEREHEILKRLRRSRDVGFDSSEPLRVLDRVARDLEMGDRAAARLRLEALGQLLPENSDANVDRAVVENLLERLPQTPARRENPFANDAFDRAERHLADGRVDEARHIWQGVIDLYRDDAAAMEVVSRARRLLNSHPLTESSHP